MLAGPIVRVVLNWFVCTVYTAVLSRYTFMAVTGCALSVVPATTLTGEVTVAPLAGVQMVTEGEAVFSVHCAAAAPASNSSAMSWSERVNSRFFRLRK